MPEKTLLLGRELAIQKSLPIQFLVLLRNNGNEGLLERVRLEGHPDGIELLQMGHALDQTLKLSILGNEVFECILLSLKDFSIGDALSYDAVIDEGIEGGAPLFFILMD